MPPFAGFIAGSYVDRVFQADAERSMNWLPARVESPSGKTKTGWVLIPRPGLIRFAKLGSSTGVRAEFEINDRAFGIGVNGARNTFYEVKADKSVVTYGNLAGDRRPQISASETQLMILSGGLGYIFQFATNTLTQITDSDFPIGAIKVEFINGVFLVLKPDSQEFAFSDFNNGLVWNGLDFADVEGVPGNMVTFIVDHLQIWFLGNNHSQAFANTGDALNPFQRIQSGFMPQGAAAVDAVCCADNTIFWLGKNADGQGIVWRANGYTPQRVSTDAIETMITGWGDLSQVSMYCYLENGHTYVRLDAPTANGGNGATVVYDVASDFWHERGFWDATIDDFRADLARAHMFCFGKHLVGDYRSGWIYEAKDTYQSDAGAAIRRIRSSPDLANGGSWTVYKLFQLMIETGVALDGHGLAPPPITGVYEFQGTGALGWTYLFSAASPSIASAVGFGPPWYLRSLHFVNTITEAGTLTIHAPSGPVGPFSILAAPAETDLVFDPPLRIDLASFIETTGSAGESPSDVTLYLGSSAGDDIPMGGAWAGDGADPQMVLQVSNDGGKTWGNERKVSMGDIGEYNKLLEWRRCGRSRNRAFRVICSEPVYAALVACDIEARGGS